MWKGIIRAGRIQWDCVAVSVLVLQVKDNESLTGAVATEMKKVEERFKRHFSGMISERACVVDRVWENLGIAAKLHGRWSPWYRPRTQNKTSWCQWNRHLVLNIRGMSAGSINSCVVSVNPTSGREAGRRNKDLKGYCIWFWYCSDI